MKDDGRKIGERVRTRGCDGSTDREAKGPASLVAPTHIVTIIGRGWAHCLSFNFPAGFPPRTMAGTLYKSRELHERTKLVNISVES